MADIKSAVNNAFSYFLYDTAERQTGNKQSRLQKASELIPVSYGDLNNSYQAGWRINCGLPLKNPKTSVDVDIMFQFLKEEKSETEIMCFLFFCAVRSIIQKDNYKKTCYKGIGDR